MASIGEPLSRGQLPEHSQRYTPGFPKSLPIIPMPTAPRPSSSSAMDISPPGASMAPPTRTSPSSDNANEHSGTSQGDQQHQSQPPLANGASNAPVGAAAAAQQPKVVQTAFIHKLYNMLEDQSIQHLISWSSNNESFVMSPSSEFSKVLAQYFKHTNISSFVRQLNMYGFHKVSDVFHTSAPDSPLWEFKHGGGNFKRGDLVGLREIKRRASRHALIHRDSFPNAPPKLPGPPAPGAPMDAVQATHDPVEARFSSLEWNLNDLHSRLTRTEDAYHAMTAKCQNLLESLIRSHQFNQDLTTHLLSLVPDPDNVVHRDILATRQDISRQLDHLKTHDDSHDSLFSTKQPFYQQTGMTMEPSVPMSPRQRPFDESRRPSLQAIGKPSLFKTPLPTHLQASPRRYGSIGSGNGLLSPSSHRPSYHAPPAPPAAPSQHPLATTSSPPAANLARRHTSADIRVHGWQGHQPHPNNHASSPYASGQSSSAWPSSPRGPTQPGDQQLRDALAQYELPRPAVTNGSRQSSPPPPHESSTTSSFAPPYANSNDAGWQLPGPRFSFKGFDASGQQTRRSSMASNVHSLLNPADTAEREGEDEGPDERKRKRV